MDDKSGIYAINILSEWSVSFIGKDYIGLNLRKDVIILSLNLPALLLIVHI